MILAAKHLLTSQSRPDFTRMAGLPLRIRSMDDNDLADGLRLKSEAGWNQVEQDWRRVLALDRAGCFVAEQAGRVVGTVVATRFPTAAAETVAWIGLMLVAGDLRGQGIGRRLMERALEYCDACGVRSVRLDATPLGEPLYRKLGFRDDFLLTRHAVDAAPLLPPLPRTEAIVSLDASRLDSIRQLDHCATGIDRSRLLEMLVHENPAAGRCLLQEGRIMSFLLERPGTHGRQLGPCEGDASAVRLLHDAICRYSGRALIVDTPDSHSASREFLTRAGFTPRRPLLRMTRGPSVDEHPEQIWASFGPEKG